LLVIRDGRHGIQHAAANFAPPSVSTLPPSPSCGKAASSLYLHNFGAMLITSERAMYNVAKIKVQAMTTMVLGPTFSTFVVANSIPHLVVE
jgi:hypothetical protein